MKMNDLKRGQNASTSDYWVTLPDGRKVWKGSQDKAYIPGTGWVDLADLDIPQDVQDAIDDDPQFAPGIYGWTPGGWIQTHDQDWNPVDQGSALVQDPPDPPRDYWWDLIQDDEWAYQSPTWVAHECLAEYLEKDQLYSRLMTQLTQLNGLATDALMDADAIFVWMVNHA